jgi:hypothetical protein
MVKPHYHAAVWLDHHEALVVHFNADEDESEVRHPAGTPRHLHCKAGTREGRHVRDDPAFYGQVCEALAPAQAILVAGPASAKAELVKHMHRHAPQMVEKIAGLETLPRLTEAQFLAEARHFFKGADRMRSQLA